MESPAICPVHFDRLTKWTEQSYWTTTDWPVIALRQQSAATNDLYWVGFAIGIRLKNSVCILSILSVTEARHGSH